MKTFSDSFRIIPLNRTNVDQFEQLIALFVRVFEVEDSAMPAKAYLQNLLEKPDFIVLAAVHENTVVGGLTGYILQKYQRAETEFLLYDLAVDDAFQRRGLATKLMHHLKEMCLQKGIAQFFVDAHLEDEHALKFYESLHPQKDAVVQYTFSFRQ